MKHRDVLQKVVALAVSGCLILGLPGCGGQSALETEPNKSQTTQEENVPYREFNAAEFLSKDVITGTVMYMGSDEGGEPSRIGNAVMINYEGKEFEKNFSDVLKDNDATWETIKKCLENDWFNSESECVELDYIGEVEWKDHSYDYFRLNVTDLTGLNSRFEPSPDWTSDQEIYVIAEVDKISDSWADELGEQIQQFSIQFFINQFDEKSTPTLGQASQSTGDTTIHGTGTTLVETDYYTVEIPMEWDKYCSYEETSEIGEHRLTFYIKDEYMEDGYDGTLLELAAVENPENLDGELYTYECQICEYRVVLFDLMRRTPENVSVKRHYQELLISLQEFVPYVVQSIKEKDGYTLSYDPIKEDDGIPYVDAWAGILGTIYEPKQFFAPLGNRELAPHFHANAVDDVTYYVTYSADSWTYSKDLVYGVRDGYIVAYMALFDFPEVHTMLSSDFDGIEPKIIINDNSKYLIWEVNNGYVIFEVGHSERGYLYDLVMYMSCFTDKEMCSLLMEN